MATYFRFFKVTVKSQHKKCVGFLFFLYFILQLAYNRIDYYKNLEAIMWIKQFKKQFEMMTVFYGIPLKDYTYTKTGGNAEVLAFPETIEQLQQLVRFSNQNQVEFTVLGNASNVIITDGGLSGIVIMLEKMNAFYQQDTMVTAQAGLRLVDLSKFIQQAGLTGFEFACGIPGSVGGAIYMNAGAYGGEMKDVIVDVTVITKTGDIKQYTNNDMAFAYRHSKIQDTGDIVVETTLQLSYGNQKDIDAKVNELTLLRTAKQPLEYPSCGSVFKRPIGHFAGQLIQEANLQGYRIGGVEVSKKHAGFMVNIDNGTASDYMNLIAHVKQVVKEKFDVTLETEVRFIGK